MRKSVLMGAMMLPPAAIGITLTIRASAEKAQFYSACFGRALVLLLRTRTQNLSA
jgi:hypothetical protein